MDWAEELTWNLEGSRDGCVGARWHVGPRVRVGCGTGLSWTDADIEKGVTDRPASPCVFGFEALKIGMG